MARGMGENEVTATEKIANPRQNILGLLSNLMGWGLQNIDANRM